MAMTDVSARREQLTFAKVESTFGTLVVPAAANGIFVTDVVDHSFEPEVIEDAQIRSGMSKTVPFQGRCMPGKWGVKAYLKPSGVATTAPELDLLLECAMGKVSEVGGSNRVKYALGSTFQSFSLWRMIGHTVYQMAGCIVQTMTLHFNGTELLSCEFSGEFARRYVAGYTVAPVGGIAAGATAFAAPSGQSKRFSAGAYIQLGTDTCTGAGYRVVSVTPATDTIMFTPAAVAGCTGSAVVRGYYPATCTEVGDPVHGKLGVALLETLNFKTLTGSITVTTGLKMYTDEKNNSLYVDEFAAPVKRDVAVELTAYHYKDNTKLHYGVDNMSEYGLVLPGGNVSPNIVTALVPKLVIESDPIPTGAEEQVITVRGRAYASASLDDELVLVFGTTGDA